jgi:hypothetical protein
LYGPGSAKQRFAKSYALHRARDTGDPICFAPFLELLRHLAVIYRFRARINFALLSMRSVKLSC